MTKVFLLLGYFFWFLDPALLGDGNHMNFEIGQLIISRESSMLSTIETGFASENHFCHPIHYSTEYSTDFPIRSTTVDQGQVAVTTLGCVVDWWHQP